MREIHVIRRHVKNVRIELRDGEIVVIAPRWVNVEEVIKRKEDWINRNLRKIEEIHEKARREVDSRGVRILDRHYTVRKDCKNVGVKGGELQVCKKRNNALREKLSEMLRKDIEARVKKYSRILGVKPNRIYIREQKTKWGSCSSRNNLSFNLNLIFQDSEFRDYIVAHESAHLLHRNHGKEFKATLKNLGGRIPEKEEMLYYWYYAEECKEKLFL